MANKILLSLISLTLLLTGCVGPATALKPTPTTIEPTPTPVESTPTHIPVDIPPIHMKAIQELADSSGIPASDIQVLSAEAVDWPDGCLGAARPGMMCTQVITPGFRIIMEANGLQYEYHTNIDGSQIVSAARIIAWTRNGGIAGFCDELAIYLPEEMVASSCKTGSAVDYMSVLLSVEEREQLISWVKTYSSQTLTRKDNATADSMTVEIVLAGQGTEKVDAAAEKQMFDLLGTIYARMLK